MPTGKKVDTEKGIRRPGYSLDRYAEQAAAGLAGGLVGDAIGLRARDWRTS